MSGIELIISLAIIVILGAISIILSSHFVRKSDERWKKAVIIVLLVIFLCILIYSAFTLLLGFCLDALDSRDRRNLRKAASNSADDKPLNVARKAWCRKSLNVLEAQFSMVHKQSPVSSAQQYSFSNIRIHKYT